MKFSLFEELEIIHNDNGKERKLKDKTFLP